MRRFILGIITLFWIAHPLFSQERISGPLNGTLEAGTYIVEGNINVPNGADLTIEPGAILLFLENVTFTITGHIEAVGTEEDSIVFRPYNNAQSWGGIEFLPSPDRTKILEYCLITGSNGNGITCTASQPTISHCRITNNEGFGIRILDYYSEISYCDISYNEEGGIYISGSPEISYCNIHNNNGSGIHSTGGMYDILYCIISDNYTEFYGGGIFSRSSWITLSHCLITNNTSLRTGGGIFSWDIIEINNCTVSNNTTFENTNESAGGIDPPLN